MVHTTNSLQFPLVQPGQDAAGSSRPEAPQDDGSAGTVGWLASSAVAFGDGRCPKCRALEARHHWRQHAYGGEICRCACGSAAPKKEHLPRNLRQ
jgi:hypothetical protein